ncbi:unnamed protein product, partial [Lampetra planeri]
LVTRSRTSADEEAPLDSRVGVWKAKRASQQLNGLEWKDKTDPLRNLIKELMEIRWYDASSLPRLQSLLDMLSQDRPENEKEMLFKVFMEEGGPVGKEFEKTGDIAGDPTEEIKLWPEQRGKVYIPYNVSIAFNASDTEAIQQASDELTEKTCVRLIPKDPQEDYFYFRALGRDSSLPGASAEAGARSITLEPNKVDKGVVLRELKRAFGFHRDQQNTNDKENIQQAVNEFAEETCIRLIRKDNQEDYINFQALDGVEAAGASSLPCHFSAAHRCAQEESAVLMYELGQFKRLECSGSGEDLPYDYLSIMHYGRYASSSDHMSETITPTTAAKAPIGQRSGLSPLDVLRVHRKYQPFLQQMMHQMQMQQMQWVVVQFMGALKKQKEDEERKAIDWIPPAKRGSLQGVYKEMAEVFDPSSGACQKFKNRQREAFESLLVFRMELLTLAEAAFSWLNEPGLDSLVAEWHLVMAQKARVMLPVVEEETRTHVPPAEEDEGETVAALRQYLRIPREAERRPRCWAPHKAGESILGSPTK